MSFIVYSKLNCPYCTKAKKFLELTEQRHVVYNLERDFTKSEFYEKFGEGSTFPQIIKDSENIGGCSDLIKYLREQKIL